MNHSYQYQRGAILVVCLVVLAIITLISVTELSNAGEQTKMTSNFQQQNTTFQAAESAMSHAMKMISEQTAANEENMMAMGTAMTAPGSSATKLKNDTLSINNMEVTVEYRTETENVLRPGISLDSSQNDFMIRKVNFTATSTAVIDGSGANTTIVQGFTYE